MSLPIRTGVIRQDGAVEFHAGGGIVADSNASAEWEELQTKASFFRQVLKEAEFRCRFDDVEH